MSFLTKEVIILDYQASWQDDFLKLKRELLEILRAFNVTIEHVGSTSVFGLASKPIIDCDIVIERKDFLKIEEVLIKQGFVNRGDLGIQDRYAFSGPDLGFKYHLYVTFNDAEAFKNHLYLRNWLRQNVDDRLKYEALKKELAEKHRYDIDAYIDGKSKLIEDIYKKAKSSIYLEKADMMDLDRLEEINLSYQDLKVHNGVQPEPDFIKKCFIEGDLPPIEGATKDHFDLLSIKDYHGSILGFVMGYRGYPTKDTFWISLMIIDSNLRNQGYGYKTIEHLTDYAKRNLMKKMGLGVSAKNERGRHFWKQSGFSRVIKTYTLSEGNPQKNYLYYQLEKEVLSVSYQEAFESYLPKNEQESKDQALILQFIKHNSDCLLRTNLAAHVTSSAFIINPKMTKILFAYHHIYDSWAWVGGHNDGNPNLLEVAMKEAMEETGLKEIHPYSHDIFTIDVIQVTNHLKHGAYIPDHLHLNATFLFIADENQEIFVNPKEHKDVKWFDLDDVFNHVTEKRMIPVYKKAFDEIKNIRKKGIMNL